MGTPDSILRACRQIGDGITHEGFEPLRIEARGVEREIGMSSRFMARSGIAVGLIADLLEWKPDLIIQVGVGLVHKEVEVLHQEWPECEWIGFEAHPDIASKVNKEYPGSLFPIAVTDVPGSTTLYTPSRHKDGSSLWSVQDDCKPIEVSASNLDSLVSRKKLDESKEVLLWLDCEGGELNALKGSEEIIGRVNVINVEMTALPPSTGWCKPHDLHRWLRDHRFIRQWTHTQRSTSGQYDAIYVRESMYRQEYSNDPYVI